MVAVPVSPVLQSVASGYVQPGLRLIVTDQRGWRLGQAGSITGAPGGVAALTLSDVRAGSTLVPGLWHTVHITGSGDGITGTVQVDLLVGGSRVYLPLVSKDG